LEKPQLMTTRSERFCYGLYFFGQLIFYILVTSFLNLFMTEIGIPAAVVAGVLLIAKVWDAVNDPLFGVIIDKTNRKGGKYLPWVRLSTFLIPAATILVFLAPTGASVQIKTIWVAIGYILWDTSYTLCDVPVYALATAMTSGIRERENLYISTKVYAFVGGLFVTIAAPILFPTIGWGVTAIVLSVFGIATMLPVGFKAKERVLADAESNPPLSALVRYLVTNKYLLIFNGAVILAALTSFSSVVGNYCAIYCLGGTQWISAIALAASLPMGIAVIFARPVVNKVDKTKAWVFCHLASLALGILLYFAGYENKALFFTITCMRAFFSSFNLVIINMFTADCAEYGNFKSGDRAQGLAFSAQTFTAKITGALSGGIGMLILGIVGFAEGSGAAQTAETVRMIWLMYTVLPAVTGVLSALALALFYKLPSADVAIMVRVNSGEITREEAQPLLSRRY